jgi:hypothetical protein
MDVRAVCQGSIDVTEPTLDALLAEPIVRLLMARDGVEESALRRLASEIRARIAARASQARPARA